MTADPVPAPRGLTRQDVFSTLGALSAVLTLVTAVMFYFGWRRSDAQARAMSIDVSLFGYSTQDYVLRSISSLYLPLLVLLGAGLVFLELHSRVSRRLGVSRQTPVEARASALAWTRRVTIGCAVIAGSCVLFALSAGSRTPSRPVAWLAELLRDSQWVVPLVLVAATLTGSYVWWVHRQLRPDPATRNSLWQSLLPSALIAGTVVLGGFWMLEEYAAAVGRGYAQQLADNVDRLAQTVILSSKPLGIVAAGVAEDRSGAADSPDVRYRTSGLRLLARSGGNVLLVHDGWAPATGTVIVLPDSDEFGWEFSR